MPDPRDEFTMLCEGCGYVVEGLPPEGNCPECGRPIEQSSPARRAGTPWQRRPGAASWWRTVGLVLRHPQRAWGLVQIEPTRAGLGPLNISLAGVLIAVVAATRLLREAELGRSGATLREAPHWSLLDRSAMATGWFVVFWITAVLALAMLTQIESWGVRFFGNRRGWRVTPAVANTVCGHASVGWLIAAVMWAACALAVDTGLARRAVASLGIPRPPPSIWLRALAPLAGFLLGLLVFECLVYLGVRRNRFANRARPRVVQLPRHR